LNVYFCGMIGSGKTTIGTRLADTLGLAFFDLDQEMNNILGYSFHKLVEQEGWLAFRELEYSICKKFTQVDNAIIALGGGTVRYDWNVDILKTSGKLILLTASLASLVERVKSADRPRVNQDVSLAEDVNTIWTNSKDKYQKAADLIYSTDQKNIDQEVEELKEIVTNYLKI